MQRRECDDEREVTDLEVSQLRLWGTDTSFEFPEKPARVWSVGAADDNDVVLIDPCQYISGKHALLVRVDGVWTLRDRDSKNGVRVNGVRCFEAALRAGDEVRLGSLSLVAESARSAALRARLLRLVGWDAGALRTVDHILQLIRTAETKRLPLYVVGPSSVIDVAAAIHRGLLGEARPFVVCDPSRPASPATARWPGNVPGGQQALIASDGGTLCLPGALPRDLVDVAKELLDPRCRTRLVFQNFAEPHEAPYLVVPIRIPALGERGRDLERLVRESVAVAQAELEIARDASDVAALIRAPWRTVGDLEKGVRRLVVVRVAPTLKHAARRLEMSATALGTWMERHGLAIYRNG